jgi:carboxyl-terminal processing protease
LSACLGNTPSNTVAAEQITPIQSGNTANKTTNPTTNKPKHLSSKHSYELKVINGLLKRYHYKKFKLDDKFSSKILDHYIDQLDPAHLYFTQKDIDSFNVHRNKFDDYIRDGNTDPAVSIFTRYQQRIGERSRYAIKRLTSGVDLNGNDVYRLDRKKAPWAKDQNALDRLWDKRIKNDLIVQRLADKSEKEAVKILKKRYELLASRTAQIKDNELFQLIANAYASTLEPHTAYFSPRLTEEFNIQMSLSLSGIGAVLRAEDEYIKIVSVVPGGPAELTGKIGSGDRVIGVAQGKNGKMIDVVGWRLTDVVNLIRGKKGSTVVLSVLPAATGLSGSAEKVAIVRDKIKLEHQAASKKIIEVDRPYGKIKVGIIDLPSFYIDFQGKENGNPNYRSTSRDIKKLLQELKQEGIDELIIDLRGNGGGSLSEVVKLTGLFIDTGAVVQINDTDGRTEILKDRDSGIAYDGPLAVMIDKGSASASEIFAGAIQDYKRGIIIGETSFGKGTVQTVLPLNSYARARFEDPYGQLKVTTAQFFRVNGDSTQYHGVVPDISWSLPKIEGDFGERSLKNALPWRRIAEARHQAWSKSFSNSALQKAKQKSRARIMKTPKFVSTINKFKLLVKAGNEKTVSLNLAKRKAKREKFNHDLLVIENQLQAENHLKAYKTIKELQDAQKAQNDDIFHKDKKPVDVFLIEAAQILGDVFNLKTSPAMAARNK